MLYLNVGNNRLEYIPKSIGELISLKQLFIAETEGGYYDKLIKCIPHSIMNLKTLENTDLIELNELPWIKEFINSIIIH